VTTVGRQFTLGVVNIDEDVIRRFDDSLCLGQPYAPYKNPMNDGYKRKPFIRWIGYEYNALDAMQLLAPWLSTRRLDRAFELTGIRFPGETLPI
jgi:hypothetical protein